ncbi:MAG TPA: transcriptional repressor LexA, partial [Clostridia bacterium]|nr:transcriptional repressor LexA [Clostridia bacterium]
ISILYHITEARMGKFGATQAAVFHYIEQYFAENDIPPTVREICTALELKSTSTVHAHLKNLADKGLIRFSPTKQRSITIVSRKEKDRAESARRVPLVGRVAAGEPIFAEQNIQETFMLSPALLRGASENEVFMLKVSGESMIDAGIQDGDTIVVHKGLSVENGDIVVALVRSEEATVKRFYKNKDGTVRLQPENSAMPPIILAGGEVEIVGRLIGLYRRY